MISVSVTPVSCVDMPEVEIVDKNVFVQQKKDIFDLHWKLKILHGKFKFAKKIYFFDSQKNNVNKVKFALSEKGCDSATIEFDYIDTFLQPGDIVELYALDRIVYAGRISTVEGNKAEIQPLRARLSELRYKGAFDKTFSALQIIESVLNEKNLDSGVEFNRQYIDNEFYKKMAMYYLPGDYKVEYESIADVIDNLVRQIDSDAVWGVNEIGAFFIKYPETSVSQFFFKTQQRCDYAKISIAENWDAIEMTRAAVTRAGRKFSDEEKEKNPALVDEDDSVFCGVVGYESSPDYPVLYKFENLVGKKEALIHLSTMLTADSVEERNRIALDYAYTMITAQSTKRKITLQKVPFRPELLPSQLAYVQNQDNGFLVLSDCSSLNGWSNGEIVKEASVFGDSHLRVDKVTNFILDRDTNFPEQDFFVFCAKFSLNDFFTVEFFNSANERVFSRTYQIISRNWAQFRIEYKKSFRRIRFAFPAEFDLDMLQVYCLNNKIYNINIKKITTEIKNGIAFSSVELGSQAVTANDRLHYLEWKFKQIDAINTI